MEWSESDDMFFYIDTPTCNVDLLSYDSETGEIGWYRCTYISAFPHYSDSISISISHDLKLQSVCECVPTIDCISEPLMSQGSSNSSFAPVPRTTTSPSGGIINYLLVSGNREAFYNTENSTYFGTPSIPGGMTVDNLGNIWLATSADRVGVVANVNMTNHQLFSWTYLTPKLVSRFYLRRSNIVIF